MVSKELFGQAVQKIRNTYSKQDFLSSPDALSDWYEMFKDCSEWSFKQAVNQTIAECKYLPVLAEVHTRYKEFEQCRIRNREYFITDFHLMCHDYPGGCDYIDDFDCGKKIMELTTKRVGGDYEEGKRMLGKYRMEMKKYIQSHKEEDLPNFKDYLMGLE